MKEGEQALLVEICIIEPEFPGRMFVDRRIISFVLCLTSEEDRVPRQACKVENELLAWYSDDVNLQCTATIEACQDGPEH